jgi:hypothetical protein
VPRRRALFYILFIILVISTLAGACSFEVRIGAPKERRISGEAVYGRLIVTDNVDEVSGEPRGERVRFDPMEDEIYAAIQVKNVRAPARFTFSWSGPERGTLVFHIDISSDVVENWVYSFVKPTEPLPAGEYHVAVSQDGQEVGRASFAVSD